MAINQRMCAVGKLFASN